MSSSAAAAAAAAPKAASSSGTACVLDGLDLHPFLRERINEVYPPPLPTTSNSSTTCATNASTSPSSGPRLNAVLYLPTVCLRYEHNPAFALACHVANSLEVPVVVLAIVPDDAATPRHRSSVPSGVGGMDDACKPAIAMTARRLTFHLEALSAFLPSLSTHGAAAAVRIHGPKCRTPDHLTLSRRARFVVCDEPFVDPYLGLVQKVERAARGAGVRCVRVDGSTTVPPAAVLRRLSRRRTNSNGNGTAAAYLDEDDPSAPLLWEGVPGKAWMWQKKTEGRRMVHLKAAVVEGAFDAPDLTKKIARDWWFLDDEDCEDEKVAMTTCPSADAAFLAALPPTWRNPAASVPGIRPWSASDLASLSANNDSLRQFATTWPGADPTVPPCPQTIGTHRAGMARWNAWVRDRNGLANYGRNRNDMRKPHSPSRMSAYLNLGVVSIFRLVHEVKTAQARKIGGADKYEEEIVKWREMAYAHCFSRTDYGGVAAVPAWAQRSLDQKDVGGFAPLSSVGWDGLALGRTGIDAKWDVMQRYLMATGELHNNVRMTWGKTVVGWSARLPRSGDEGISVTSSVLQTLCYLNDRYALDGLSPPSYAGLLWCMGWCDKPGRGGGISPKPASNYRHSAEDFRLAERALLAGPSGGGSSSGMKHSVSQSSILDMMKSQQPKAKKQRTGQTENGQDASSAKKSPADASKKKGSIASFFSPKNK